MIELESYDHVGNNYTVKLLLILDRDPPQLILVYSQYTKENSTILKMTVKDDTMLDMVLVETQLDTKTILNPPTNLTVNIELLEGNNTVKIIVKDLAGNSVSKLIWIIRDTKPPVVEFISPENGTVTRNTEILIKFNAYDDWTGVSYIGIYVNDNFVSENVLSLNITLPYDGKYSIKIVTRDNLGNEGRVVVVVIKDTEKPTVNVLKPTNGTLVNSTLELHLKIEDENPENVSVIVENNTLWVNETDVKVFINLSSEGVKKIIITAYDKAGNENELVLIVTSDQTPPKIEVKASKTNFKVGEEALFELNVTDNYGVKAIEIYINGKYVGSLIQNFNEYKTVFTRIGQYTLVFKAIDLVGNSKSFVILVNVEGNGEEGPGALGLIAMVVLPLSLLVGLITGYIKTRRG